ncbi:DUF4232 domain-containing protein [Streptomyces sp. NPDC005820]|uniref:DUF4232 domain-containing protein n=1 Tax=Streptomyces sp. NPDC005820 TaxID=3157069 RepID=UPI0033C495D7
MRLRNLTAAITVTAALGLGMAASGGTASAGTGDAPAPTAPACDTSALRIAFDGKAHYSAPGEQIPVIVHLTNTSGTACSLQGFPDVDLNAGSDTWSLLHNNDDHIPVTLTPGTSAHFAITYISWQEGMGTEFDATSATITLPGATTSVTLPWPGSSIVGQNGATHPGTYVGPISL